ncbi:MAG: glycosyltransferase family 39 protein [Candidatus Methanoperedens sp.]|nr:glycosyltransferase family 39 protein [Candidatus Methanoperedens sp.]
MDSSIILHIFVSIIITSFTGLILSQLGLFSLFNLVAILALTSIILYQKYKKLPEKPKFNPIIEFNTNNVLVTLLIISSVLLFFHPFPWIAGGRDPGVYVSTGVHIAKTGSILIKDPLIAQMNTSIQEILYDVEPASVYGFISWANMNSKFQFPGFYITDLGTGTITPQFLHIYPVWIAIFYSIFGLLGVFYVNPVFGVMSIISLYLLGKRLFSWKVGILAGFILMLNFAQIWYVRYPSSEMAAQFFSIAGLVIFIQFNKSADRYLAIISALFFGLLFLTKIEGLMLLAPLGLYFIYIGLKNKWNNSCNYFLASLFIVLIYSLFDYFIFTKPYIDNLLEMALNPPLLPEYFKYSNPFTGLIMFSWYETYIGIFLSIAGFSLIFLKREKKEKIFLVFIALIFSVPFLLKLSISPDHPWWARRFITLVFPLYALFTSYILNEIANLRKIGIYLYFSLTAILIMSLATASYPIINHFEGAGMTEGVSGLSKYFNESDVIIMGPSFEGGEISTPLYYIYDRKVILISRFNPIPNYGIRDLPAPENISLGIDYLLNRGYNVYTVFPADNIYMEKLLYYLSSKNKIDFIGNHEFSYKHMDSTTDSLSNIITDVPMNSLIYRISKSKADVPDNFSINIGSPSDVIYLESGFYARENWGEINNRWTSGNASIRIPTAEKNNLLISVYGGGFRPEKLSPGNFSIYINEHLLGNFTAYGEYKFYNMTAPKDYLTIPYSTVLIRSDTWKPSEITGTADTRDIGINIDKISIEQILN